MTRLTAHLGLTAALFMSLVAMDLLNGSDPFLIAEFVQDVFEWALISMGAAATSYAVLGLRDAQLERRGLASELIQAKADGDRWRAAARVYTLGLGAAIHTQFDSWRLTAGEADVAILMLKGLSHKEIANLRHSSAATVRQQAAAVYGKSGLSSRAELAAYFLEDLFPSEAVRNGVPMPAFKPVESGAAGPIPHLS
jgi:DNA-binding CsgD family transcriptional regulator